MSGKEILMSINSAQWEHSCHIPASSSIDQLILIECQGQYELVNFLHSSPVDIDGTPPPPVMFHIWVTKVFF